MSEFNLTFWDLKRDGTRYISNSVVHCNYSFVDGKFMLGDNLSVNKINQCVEMKFKEVKEPTKEEIFFEQVKGKKIRKPGFAKDQYVVVKKVKGKTIYVTCKDKNDWEFTLLFLTGWEFYKEKKRYWQWNVKSPGIEKYSYYLDDNGIDTAGEKPLEDWDDIWKQKIENDYIEV